MACRHVAIIASLAIAQRLVNVAGFEQDSFFARKLHQVDPHAHSKPHSIEVEHQRSCKGFEKEYSACPNLPKCGLCTPEDCRFADWGDWSYMGGCTSLCSRMRYVKSPNNECGAPCSGPKTETKRCMKKECEHSEVDCKFNDWSEWSVCDSPVDQKMRIRTVGIFPLFGGKECDGPINETVPCGKRPSVDCTFSEWGAWTECTQSCGGGYHAAMRRIMRHADLGGAPCSGATSRIMPCKTKPCSEGKPCILGPWSEWQGCNEADRVQKSRSRKVEQPSQDGGKPCRDAVKETASCLTVKHPVSCRLPEWGEWQQCPVTCGGGQTFRKRQLEDPEHYGVHCATDNLMETAPCNTMICKTGEDDCQLSQWTPWSTCSTTCGLGVSVRKRKVLSPARGDGKPCNEATEFSRGCNMDKLCDTTDCVWGDWEEWGACTCTCGGGTKRRDRLVMTAPENGGDLCKPENKSELAACNTLSCEVPIDGMWNEWSHWSPCSSTCGSGLQSRHRDIAQHSNALGKPVQGLQDDYKKCEARAKCMEDIDCKVSDWTEWSRCSCTCFGVRERHRQVQQYAVGFGKPCGDVDMKSLSPCNPGIGDEVSAACGKPAPKDCKMEDWDDWGECSEKCEGGHRTRVRSYLPSDSEGLPCQGELSEVRECNSHKCPDETCLDCRWTDWSDWGACLGCAGQRYRHRSVHQLPNHCGKVCKASDSKQIGSCDSPCHKDRWCAWGDWSTPSRCSASCGSATKLRHRVMEPYHDEPAEFLFKGEGPCNTNQWQALYCNTNPCAKHEHDPVDCSFGEWGDWGAPTCTQLCERTRVMKQMNKYGGLPCSGSMVETKRCVHHCDHPVDCKLSEWREWTSCAHALVEGSDGKTLQAQRTRMRTILAMGSKGGQPCEGPLAETHFCGLAATRPQSCEMSEWTVWSPCSLSCGSGRHHRMRSIAKESTAGGEPCTGSLSEVKDCNNNPCETKLVNCTVADWSEWGACTSSAQRYRSRHVTQEGTGGRPCDVPLKEIEPCSLMVDCHVSQWTAWDACDKTCGAGQHQRQRLVLANPQHGGKECPKSLMETQGCNVKPCGVVDCEVTQWNEWGTCTETCGSGIQIRARHIERMPQEGGDGCQNELKQLRTCAGDLPSCAGADCLWGQWSEWGSCTCTCDGGQKTREREIIRNPKAGGEPCKPWSKEEVQPCNTISCNEASCVDGEWDDWADWESCSKSCTGGLTSRLRKIRREANSCGKPAVGPERMTASCNTEYPCIADVDCKFSSWGAWSDCTKECDGVKRRSRQISAHRSGAGSACHGALKVTVPCNSADDNPPPLACSQLDGPKIDCNLDIWQEWSDCTTSCEGGQTSRARAILNGPLNGGKACTAVVSETKGCNTHPCHKEIHVDCLWGEWSVWSACDKCAGQRKRVRHIMTPPRGTGKACDPGSAEEMSNCSRRCHEPLYCTFAEWSDWEACPYTCGAGERARTRHLKVATQADLRFLVDDPSSVNPEALEAQYQVMTQKSQYLKMRQLQEIAVAFTSGLLSLLVGFVAFNRFEKVRRRCQQRDERRNTWPAPSDTDVE